MYGPLGHLSIKTIFDRYQQAIGTSLWNEQYENMQRTLSHLKDINRNLRTEIRQRMGEDLDSLEFDDLRVLEQNVDVALKEYHVISTQTDTYKKKRGGHSARHPFRRCALSSCGTTAMMQRQPDSRGGFVGVDLVAAVAGVDSALAWWVDCGCIGSSCR
ncbi:hypothetical protein PR202_ga14389 [Eleusine coracana subsp. coracana]|uniref:K-box domain-containing protein n=1 Tax=Eleusine coracana subsp. coracana TaxID=191504 RepID=A0AAV5CH56_ELECO|nr:hypothetical protein PR202_ga14389 [Eleusine coracana subsp. coracana]